MGRIHRYGQEKDCLIFNFVSTNTREGRVLHKLFERIQAIEDDLDPRRTGKVFNVLGDVFPANQLEKMIREMYVRNQTEDIIKQRIIEQVDTKRLESITNSTLEGLAKRELNLSAIIGKSAEARERRLVPEVIEGFFTQAAPIVGVHPSEIREGGHVYKLGKVPRTLWPVGERLEPRFGKLGREYRNRAARRRDVSRRCLRAVGRNKTRRTGHDRYLRKARLARHSVRRRGDGDDQERAAPSQSGHRDFLRVQRRAGEGRRNAA
jgi:hypothetical protein